MSDTDALLQRLQDERACEALIHAFCFRLDHGESAQVVELFSEDGVFDRRGEALQGRAAIAAAMAARPANMTTRHVCANIMLAHVSATQITGVTYFQFFRHGPNAAPGSSSAPADLLEVVGEYHDSFERTSEGWRIARRLARAVFERKP
ncbi:MAG: nuclear transport factor 2 family protein [Caldimonas sp.]